MSTTVASVQFEPVFGAVDSNIERMEKLTREASAKGAKLVVFPELCTSGYMFSSRSEAYAYAQPANGETYRIIQELCSQLGVYVVYGFPERSEGNALYNSAALVGPTGLLGVYRKNHLWNEEALYFEPGDKGFPVVNTEIGKLSMLICYDGWFPESFRECALGGADIICMPTNWVPIPGQREGEQAMATILAMSNAHENGLFVIAADRVGVEREQPFIGQSVIVDHTGWLLSGPASDQHEQILYADIDSGTARRQRCWNNFNTPLRDRRPDQYSRSVSRPI
ncbi:MAG: nitrilase family protein [Bifidobacterium psychraerophilum]|jgi:predicted amidohydrolase|uniref:nitrilase family protein n=1 Tax=Bifidobacterium psychraerophilum TaxID=218140 RepID=UPI0039EA6907